MLALLGAGQGAFFTGPHGSLRQEQPRLGAFFPGLGGRRREKMGQSARRVRKGRKLGALTGLAADRVDLCLAKLRRDLSRLLKKTGALVAESLLP